MKNYRYLVIATLLFLFSTSTAAVELGEIDVDSHLGVPFHAEVPLALDADEVMSHLSVGLAEPTDYRTLNIHRDPAVNMIRADLVRDQRGSRVEFSSLHPISAPFFTLVLKVRYQRATHYKKYSATLDLPRAGQTIKRPEAVLADVGRERQPEAAQPMVEPMVEREVAAEIEAAAETKEVAPSSSFQPFDGWARISRYGPTVYGDILYVIADRLRIDDRYASRQVMVALFEKNRSSFAEENLNLPLSGSYFDVPTAEEVERLTYEQAMAVIAEHDKRWQELKQQPRHAATAEAQRNRYSNRAPVHEDVSDQ